MKHDPYFKYLAATILVALVLAFIAPAHGAEARERTRKRSGTYTTDQGRSGTFEGSVTRSQGNVQREGSVTNQDGLTSIRRSERTFDRDAGTSTYSKATTGPGGKSSTTGSTSIKNPDGTVSTEGSRTGFNGQTSTFSATTTKTDDGRTTTGSVTGPGGKTSTFNTTVTHGGGQAQKTITLTGPEGKTGEREISARKNEDGTVTRTLQVTQPNGAVSTRTETITPDSPSGN